MHDQDSANSLSNSRRLSKQSLLLLLLIGVILGGCTLPAEVSPTPTPLPYQTPDWFDHAVLYSIFVRSYADSDGDGIGDLNGITNRLDYLETLGIDVIWLLPIYPSPSYHGYDVTDFFSVNPEYGTLEDLETLVDAVHARGMHIILDFVPSHLSSQNPLFLEAYRTRVQKSRIGLSLRMKPIPCMPVLLAAMTCRASTISTQKSSSI